MEFFFSNPCTRVHNIFFFFKYMEFWFFFKSMYMKYWFFFTIWRKNKISCTQVHGFEEKTKIDNIEQFWSEKLGLGPHYTPIQAPVCPLIGTASTKLMILSSKLESSKKIEWNRVIVHLSKPIASKFVFSTSPNGKNVFLRPGWDKGVLWGVRGFQAFILSPPIQ